MASSTSSPKGRCPECAEAGPAAAWSIMGGGHRRSFPPSEGDHPGLAYRIAVTCIEHLPDLRRRCLP